MGSEIRQSKAKKKKGVCEDTKVLSQNYSCRSLHSSGLHDAENVSRLGNAQDRYLSSGARPHSGKTPSKTAKKQQKPLPSQETQRGNPRSTSQSSETRIKQVTPFNQPAMRKHLNLSEESPQHPDEPRFLQKPLENDYSTGIKESFFEKEYKSLQQQILQAKSGLYEKVYQNESL